MKKLEKMLIRDYFDSLDSSPFGNGLYEKDKCIKLAKKRGFKKLANEMWNDLNEDTDWH